MTSRAAQGGHRGRLTPLGNGREHGWCAFSQRFERWFDTRQDSRFASFPGGEHDVYCDTAFTLERGWGDLYRWQRPGQYVPEDMAADADGRPPARPHFQAGALLS